jgi:hypothetical protein
VICDSAVSLADIAVEEDWRNIPIALTVPSVGRFRAVAKKVPALRSLDLRIYLPGDTESLTGARLLTSLGIAVCVVIDGAVDWEALADLMTYALLGLVPHAPVDPFQTMADGGRQAARGDDWGHVLFDDPSRYLHLDGEGRIAMTRRDLQAGIFAANGLAELDSAALRQAIEERTEGWRSLFADNHFCARCPSWRICRGRMRDGKTAPDGCQVFFQEMAEVVERRRRKANEPVETWQP